MIRHVAMLFTVGLVVAITGCAAPASSPTIADGGGTSGTSGTSGVSESPRSPSCTAHVVAGDSANGSTLCVTRGSDLTVLLRATAGSDWSTPEASGTALGAARPVPTPAGFVGWSFPAAAAGTADVSTSRPVCPSAGSAAVRCHSVVGYLLHVEVG
jgi:hypothetical protein